MATKMELPMLSVNPCKMSNLDTNNVDGLASVWNVFHKCSHSLEDGPRLENMSWRILSRQTLRSQTPDFAVSRSKRKDDSQIQTSQLPHTYHTQPLHGFQTRKPSPLVASCSSPQKPSSQERPLPVLSMEKIVSSIQEKQDLEPLSPSITDAVPKLPTPPETPSETTIEQPAPQPFSHASHRSSNSSTSTAPASMYESERSMGPSIGSDTSAEALSCHSVVRGFSPNNASSSYRSSVHLTPADAPSKAAIRVRPESVKKGNGFMLGGSSGEDESSFEERMQSQPQQSSLTAALKPPQKQLSFREVVESRKMGHKSHEDEDVFESDDENDVSDSAIDDSDDDVDEDDEEEWEDDASENADGNDRPLFQRVDSKPNLVSRRSLLTTMMNQHDRADAFQEMAIKAAPVLKRSKTSSNMHTQEETNATGGNGLAVPQKPITRTKSDLISLVSSPKTTRRNMLSTEINEDLRKSILHERLQKKSTINAYNKRVQSARNLTTLPLHVEERDRGVSRDEFDYYGHGIGAYHQAGW